MPECEEHRGIYEKHAACLMCLVEYWKAQYKKKCRESDLCRPPYGENFPTIDCDGEQAEITSWSHSAFDWSKAEQE